MNQNIQIREERLQHLLDRHEALTTRPNDVEIPISNAPSSPLTPSPDATAKRNFLSVRATRLGRLPMSSVHTPFPT
ncbi:MAG: hypothetical protein O2960_24455, partial [Verrucomicrobia bacterium]|nr:hypothetical protein [Verrucomicrobiota bacterium]